MILPGRRFTASETSRAASQRISVVSAPKGNKNAVGNKGYTPKPDGFNPRTASSTLCVPVAC